MTDKEAAERVRRAVDELNNALAAAALLKLSCDVSYIRLNVVGAPARGVYTVRVSKEL